MALWESLYNLKSSREKEFYRQILEARSQFLTLRLKQDKEIRDVYLHSAERIAERIKDLGDVQTLTRAHLEALERNLRDEADRIAEATTTAVRRGIESTVGITAEPMNQALVRALRASGVAMDYAKLQYGFGQVSTRAVEAIWAKTKNGLTISDRIWNVSGEHANTLRDIILDAVAQGRDAVKVARDITGYVKDGARTFAGDYPNMMARMGHRIPKDTCYEALRLARTEMSMAALEGTYAAGKTNFSYKGVQWMLSGSHPVPDICDDLASADLYGLGAGCYPEGDEPPHPHPNCLCFVVPLVMDTDELIDRIERWHDDPQMDPELEKWYNEIYRSALATPPLSKTKLPTTPSQSKAKPPATPPLGSERNPIVVQNVANLGSGASRTFTGEVNGQKFLFKGAEAVVNLDMLRGNLEAELLADKVLNFLGVSAPKTDYAWYDMNGTVEPLLSMEWVSDTRPAYPGLFALKRRNWTDAEMDRFRRMQVIDVLMGNADRHDGNFLFPNNSWEVIPIDHNMAFSTDLVIYPNVTWQKAFLAELPSNVEYDQRPTHIVGRNLIGREFINSWADKQDAKEQYRKHVPGIQAQLTDAVIDTMVDALPDELAELARKDELKNVLKWRRDNLDSLIDSIRIR